MNPGEARGGREGKEREGRGRFGGEERGLEVRGGVWR